jgi:hypothetical protein
LQNRRCNKQCFTNARVAFDREFAAMRLRLIATVFLVGAAPAVAAASATSIAETLTTGSVKKGHVVILAQANIPPTGMGDEDMAMAAANMAAEQRMQRRYPQPIRVGALVGARVSDNDSRTIGYVRQVVRTPQGKIDVVVDCCGWFGFGARPVAVPIAVLGVFGREVASLDMPRRDYGSAPTWQSAAGDAVLPDNDTVQIALARR